MNGSGEPVPGESKNLGGGRGQRLGPPTWRWMVLAGIPAALALLAIVAAVAYWPGDEPVSTAMATAGGFVGTAASFAGVALAILIFERQSRSSAAADIAVHERFDAVDTTLGDLATGADAPRTEADLVLEQDEPDEEQAEYTEPGGSVVVRNGREIRVYGRDEVPLSVIADLVWGWRVDDQDGSWAFKSLLGASRATGRGNHPWHVNFIAPDGSTRIWRLYRGGKQKRTPTVRDITGEAAEHAGDGVSGA